MSNLNTLSLFDQRFYLFGSRPATHGAFWLIYYLAFSLIWMKPEVGYLGAFFLEFVLLPVRIMAVYTMLYVLMPRYLFNRRFRDFFLTYFVLLLVAGLMQRLSDHFFYESLFLGESTPLWQPSEWVRSIILVNSTVVFVGAVRLLQLYLLATDKLADKEAQSIEVKANRRTYLLRPDQILYVEGMGNYVTYFLVNGEKLVVYASIKATLALLPDHFVRLHKSYIANQHHIGSFNAEDVQVGDQTLPRGKDIPDRALIPIQ